MTRENTKPGAPTHPADVAAEALAGAAPRQQARAPVDTDPPTVRHSGLSDEPLAANLADSEAAAWDRIAELLIELALEHDPEIIEPVRHGRPPS
jgi:hypothetical protein